MSIELGSGSINKIYLGNTEIKKVYLGSDLIYDKTAAGGYLLDTYTNAVGAYSLRQLKTGVTNVVRARDGGDDSEANYTSAEVSAGYTAIGADSGFGVNLIDQASVFGDLEQNATSNQSVLLNAGTLETLNTKPAINNTVDFGFKSAGTISFSSYTELWFFAVIGAPSGSADVILESSANYNNTTGGFIIILESQTNLVVSVKAGQSNTYCRKVYPISMASQNLLAIKFKMNNTVQNTSQVWLNGVEVSGAPNTNIPENNSVAFSDETLNFLARNSSAFNYKSKVQECVIFSGDQSANRVGIEANINGYYNIY